MSARPRSVSVIGSSSCGEGGELWRRAEEVGRLLAEAGVTVVCGGRGGVMEAVARGAVEAGGTVIGILPGSSVAEANPHCTHVVATAVGQARNLAVVASGEAAIAVGGEWGTLAEIAHARSMGRTVVALASWSLAAGSGEIEDAPGVLAAATPEEAVAAALGALD
ncbi:MAG: TIGR00725 family protein [Solirubrobacterales bacterium]